MSAPSYAIYYKDGEQVGRGFINVGLYYDEERLYHQINAHGIDYDEVFAYDTTFTREFIDERLGLLFAFEKCRIYAESETRKSFSSKLVDGERYYYLKNKYEEPTPIKVPLIKKVMPDIMASDICSVQPMTGDVAEINRISFNAAKNVYEDDNGKN